MHPTEKIDSYHPPLSRNTYQEEWADWDVIDLRLSATLRCNKKSCGEQVTLHAVGGVEPDYGHDGGTELTEYYFIQTITPSPHIISLPNGLPYPIHRELVASFNVFWLHKDLAANKIRNALEAFLTHVGVPDEVKGKWVSLGNRLNTYSESSPENAGFFKILKPIVNDASHGSKIETDTLLDIYEALEIFLTKF